MTYHQDLNVVNVEYLDSRRTHIIQLNSMTRESIDIYIDTVNKEMINQESLILRSVHDYINLQGIVTPYFMGRIKEFADSRIMTEMSGRIALVSSMELFRFMFSPVVKIFTRGNKNLDIQFFTNLDDAVQWASEYTP